jgi:3-oxoacyl-[acyl-carrier-protein] synthase II
MLDRRRPQICGIGAVTGYGWGRERLWEGLTSGVSAVQLHDGYGEALDDKVWISRVPDGGLESDGPSRFGRALRASAREAVEDAMSRGWRPGPLVGLVHCVVLGEVDLWRDFYLTQNGTVPSRAYLNLMPSTPVCMLMKEFGFRGPAMNVTAMCASGSAGLLTAQAWLAAGMATDVLIVSTDISLSPENVRQFRDLGAAIVDSPPADATRPFQEGSRGFVLGEASVSYVLSTGADRPYARVLGGAMSQDPFHPISMNPDLANVRSTFERALSNAGVGAQEVAYLNAHGPGTAQCDRAEAVILDELLTKADVYSFKPLLGHCQAAAAALELTATALSYERGRLPVPMQVAPGHPRLLSGPTETRSGPTVKSALGMGGYNSVVVVDAPN